MFDKKNDAKPDPDGVASSGPKWDATDNPIDKPEFGRAEPTPTLAEEIAHGEFEPPRGGAAPDDRFGSDAAYGSAAPRRDSSYDGGSYDAAAYDEDRSATQVRHDGLGPTDYADDSTRSFAAARDDDLTAPPRDGGALGTSTFSTDADPYETVPSRYDTHPEERFATGAVPPRDVNGDGVADRSDEPGVAKNGFYLPKLGGWLLGLVRILLGWQFLWAFLDKTFGLGFSTTGDRAWINGGRPTRGFLTGVAEDPNNPFRPMFRYFLDQSWTDWVFMGGLLGIGIVLLLGLGKTLTWIAALSGIAMLALMYLAAWPAGHSASAVGADGSAATNPFLDSHLLNAVVLLALAVCNAGAYLGLAKAWRTRRAYKD